MYTIGKLLENNLSPRRNPSSPANRSRSSRRAATQKKPAGTVGTGLLTLNLNLDKAWQAMWDNQSDVSQRLDQIG